MIKAITLDLDNTLIDFMKMKTAASNAAAKAMIKAGLKMKLKDAERLLFDEYIKDIEGNHAFQDFLKKHNALSDRILAAAINAHVITKLKYLKTYPRVKSTLKKLRAKGIKLAIITDAPRLKAYQRLDAIGLADFFDVVVSMDDTGKVKPSVIPFKKTLKLLDVKPEEAMHLGDWPEKDILGAKKIGMKTCFARYGYTGQGKAVYADYKITRFDKILDCLE